MSSMDKKQKGKRKSSDDEEQVNKRSHSPDNSNIEDPVSSSEHTDVVPTVHSANSWETVNLGDDQRKAKFLKLMGAAKKEHHGRFIIGDSATAKHSRSSEEVKDMEKELKEQYEHSLTTHLKHKSKRHRGLGFDVDDQPTVSGSSKIEPKNTHIKFVSDEKDEKS